MTFLRMLLAIIGGVVTLVREIRQLISTVNSVEKKLPFSQKPVHQIEEKAIDMEQVQIDMEKLFHKNQLHPRIKSEFINSDIPFKDMMRKNGLDTQFGFDLLVQMVLHKRTTLPVLVGILRKHFKGNCQDCTDALLIACQIDLVDWNPTTKQFVVRYDISQDVQDDLDRYQFPLPMIVEPRKIEKNTDTGYYTSSNSVILKNNHHEEDVCLDHLNKMNKIRLTLNHDVVAFVANSWRNLDKPKEGEDRKEFEKRKRAFEKYDRTAKDVMVHLDIAGDDGFYLTHKYDKRGRVYCQGYHVTYQGNTWNKATIEFAQQEVVEG